jgi:ABC-2 type transport system ATP-binding protein
LDQFGLLERADDRVGGFSKGMKQRLALARTILHEPDLLFLDEPTAGLDPEASQQVMAWIEQISHQKGCTVFLCTHNLDEAERLCDRVAVLNRGHMLPVGTLPELAETLWRGSWLDIRLESPLSVDEVNAVRRVQGVRGIEAGPEGLSIQMDQVTRIPDLVCALVYQGARIQQVTPRRHTLEDIYFEIQKQPQEG